MEDLTNSLTKLATLQANGVINEAEFESRRQNLVDSFVGVPGKTAIRNNNNNKANPNLRAAAPTHVQQEQHAPVRPRGPITRLNGGFDGGFGQGFNQGCGGNFGHQGFKGGKGRRNDNWGQQWDGRFHPYGGKGGFAGPRRNRVRDVTATVKVQPLKPQVKEEELAVAFGQFGEISSIKINSTGDPCYGYVNFATKEAAADAVTCKTVVIDGMPAKISPAKGLASNVETPSNGVGLFNLPFETTEQELQNMLGEYQGFQWVKMVTRKGTNEFRGYVFAYFETVEQATNAKEMLTGLTIGENAVDVKFAIQSAETIAAAEATAVAVV